MPGLGTKSGTAFQRGLLVDRPVASPDIEGYFYFATDVNGGTFSQCDGSSWLPITSGLRTLTAGANIVITETPSEIIITGNAVSYTLPIASSSVLGGIKVGSGLFIALDGTLSATYALPIASASVLGGIKVGSNLSIDGGGVLSSTATYTLPIASASVLGGIKVGSGLAIDGTGILSNTYTPTDATTTTVGVVEIDQNPVSGHPFAVTVRTVGLVNLLAGVSNPTTAPTLSATSPSPPTSLLAGSYNVGYLWVTSLGGRTKLSNTSAITITAGQGIQAISPSLPSGVSSVEFYTSDCYGPGNSWSGGSVVGSFDSQSWSGGAEVGSFDAQSWTGGASVAGITWRYQRANNGAVLPTHTMGFLKVPNAPASDMIIFDWDLSASGYFRLKLNSTLHLILECNVTGFSGSVDINGGVALTTGVWAWIEIWPYSQSGDGQWHARGHCTQSGTDRTGQVGAFTVAAGASFSGRLGIGTTTTTSYLAFPNTSGWEMSKVKVLDQTSDAGDIGAPSSDSSGGTCLFLSRQTIGSASQLNDTSGNSNNAPAGSQGLTIYTDGPYP